jgi:hypothetical protein
MANKIKKNCVKCGKSFTNRGEYTGHIKDCKGRAVKEIDPMDFTATLQRSLDYVKRIYLKLCSEKLIPEYVTKENPRFYYKKVGKYYGIYCTYRPDSTMMVIVQQCLQVRQMSIPDLYYVDRVYGKIYINKGYDSRHKIAAWFTTPNTLNAFELEEYWDQMWRELDKMFYTEHPANKEEVKNVS